MAAIPNSVFDHVHLSDEFKEAADHLNETSPEVWARLQGALQYLFEFGRSAVAPDVRWHIVESTFGRHCGEIRWPSPEFQSEYPDQAWRGLFVAHPKDLWCVFTVLGNKASGPLRGNDWYGSAVPRSDLLATRMVRQIGLRDVDDL